MTSITKDHKRSLYLDRTSAGAPKSLYFITGQTAIMRSPLSQSIVALAAIFLSITSAQAGLKEDEKVCNDYQAAPDQRISACTKILKANVNKGIWRQFDLVNRARAYEQKGNFELAQKDYDAAVASDPKSPAYAKNQRAWFFYKARIYDSALRDINQAIQSDPTELEYLYTRSAIHIRLGSFEHALADLRRAEEMKPRAEQTGRLLHVRIMSLISMGETDQAVKLADQILQTEPDQVEIVHLKAVALTNRWDYKRALPEVETSIRLRPDKYRGYVMRARLREIQADFDGAQQDHETAIRIEPESAVALAEQAHFWLRRGKLDRVGPAIEKALSLDPRNHEAFAARAEFALARGDLAGALADAERATKFDRLDGAHARWKVRLASGDMKGAIDDLNVVLRAFPDTALDLAERGLALERIGELSRATADFKRSISANGGYKADIEKARSIARSRLEALAPDIIAALDKGPPPNSEPAPVKTANVIETAQSSTPAPPKHIVHTTPTKRVALVIGNSDYRSVPVLPNPTRDADEVARSLREVGFQSVTLASNLSREKLVDAIRGFTAEADKADWALVYFAGHGIEVNGMNYLIPVDARLATDRDVQFETVSLEQVMAATEGAKKLRLVLLDACRDNPFANQIRRTTASRSIGRGLAQVEPDSGTLVVYAAKHGQVALDGDSGNSPFVIAFRNRVKQSGTEIRKLFDLVRDDVMAATGRRQQPFSYGSVPGSEDFYFVSDGNPRP